MTETVPATPDTKPWYLSKTIWVNILMLILAVLQSDLVLSLNVVSPEMVASIMGVVNFVLRLLTTKPVTASKPAK